ncbi:MAG: CPBP family intramembrane metalloprotease [Bacteroidales bacterium]|nr:CPBP family intramembrane metalloprotease [Bacteroidales bacterium]
MAARGNYKFLDKFSWYVPGVRSLFILLLWFIIGAVLGSIVTVICTVTLGIEAGTVYGSLLSYPIMFIPPMVYAGVKSASLSMDHAGVKLDSNNFSPLGGLLCVLLVSLMTLSAGFSLEPVTSLLPQMPDYLKQLFKDLTSGNIWLNLLMVSIFAPICEEWLCRGMVLRGLLASKVKPYVAILVSALFFAFIHLNPWQAIPAFVLGCLFGYVYYKTGSLKLTMLMHFVNNTFALVVGHIDSFKEMESWKEVFPARTYWILVAACAMLMILCVLAFKKITLTKPEGNMDAVPSIFDTHED